ncbi:MAG: hypothetical protein AAGF73_14415 [Actinomycetota bacterium]
MIEIRTFRLRAGVDPERFSTLVTSVQTGVYYQQPGFVRQTIGRSGDTWLILTSWASPEAAERDLPVPPTKSVASDVEALHASIEAGSERLERYVGLD